MEENVKTPGAVCSKFMRRTISDQWSWSFIAELHPEPSQLEVSKGETGTISELFRLLP